MDLEAYFRRIDFTGRPAPSRSCLEALHLAHATHIPFENLDIQLGLPISLDLEALEEKLVRRRRGGYCFEHNTFFAELLRRLGFRVQTLEARVRFDAPRLLPRTHMALRVDFAEEAFLVDVGFGGEGLLGPVPWDGSISPCFGQACRLVPEGPRRVLQAQDASGWQDFYALEPEPAQSVDFLVANHYTSTHPESRFVRILTAQLPTPGARHVLRDRSYTVRRGDRTVTTEVRDPEHLLRLLREVFGLDFPPGTRFRIPAFPEA